MPKTPECPWCSIIEKLLTAESKIVCPNCGAKIKVV
jgi:DNA-directed RNA polymerase subunit RPC12/RpoP